MFDIYIYIYICNGNGNNVPFLNKNKIKTKKQKATNNQRKCVHLPVETFQRSVETILIDLDKHN